MEAIHEATEHVRRDGRRPAILVLRVGSEAITPLSGKRRCANSCGKAARSCTSCPRSARNVPPASSARAKASPRNRLNCRTPRPPAASLNLGQVLGDGAKDSGGRHDQVVSTTLVPALERMADEFLNQYAITCALPPGAKPDGQAVGVDDAQGCETAGPGAAAYALILAASAAIISFAAATVSFGGLP